MEESYVETKVEVLENNLTKVTVSFDAKDISARIRAEYKEAAEKYNFPGFRRGKAPRQIIDNALGKDAVRGTVTDSLINDSYPLAVDACDLYPIGQPRIEAAELVVDGQPYEFTFTVEVKPVFELTSYEPVSIEVPSEEVTEAEIDEQVDGFREHYFVFVDADDDVDVKSNSRVRLSMKALDENGEAIEGLADESREYSLGAGLMPAEFDARLVGLKKGENVAFTLLMPAEPQAMLVAYADKTSKIDFDITVAAVMKKELPEATDEWVKESIGFAGLQELREALRQSLQQQKSSAMPRIKENAVLKAIEERFEGEPPASMCEDAESTLLQDFFQQLQYTGMTFDAYLAQEGMTAEEFKEDAKRQAVDVAKQDLALDAWARHFDIKATDAEVEAEFMSSGADDPQALMQQWRENGQLYLVREGVTRTKAVIDLINTATITNPGADEVVESEPEEEAEPEPEPEQEAAPAAEPEPAAEEPLEVPAEE